MQYPANQPATAGHDGSPRLDCQAAWTCRLWDLLQLGHRLLGERGRGGHRIRLETVGNRETAAGIERIEVLELGTLELQQSKAHAKCGSPGIDRAELRADVEMDAPPANWTSCATAGLDHCRQLFRQDPELGRGRTDRKRAEGLWRHLRVHPNERVLARAALDQLSGQGGRILR